MAPDLSQSLVMNMLACLHPMKPRGQGSLERSTSFRRSQEFTMPDVWQFSLIFAQKHGVHLLPSGSQQLRQVAEKRIAKSGEN
jgi:hypothetical protein